MQWGPEVFWGKRQPKTPGLPVGTTCVAVSQGWSAPENFQRDCLDSRVEIQVD